MSDTGLRQPNFFPGIDPTRWSQTIGGSLLLWMLVMVGMFLTRAEWMPYEANIALVTTILPFLVYVLANKTIIVSGKTSHVFLALLFSGGIVYGLTQVIGDLKDIFKNYGKKDAKKAWPALLTICLSWILIIGLISQLGLIDFSLPYETI